MQLFSTARPANKNPAEYTYSGGTLTSKRSISRILFPIEIGWRSFLWADRCRSARAAYPRDWRRAAAVLPSEERSRSHAWPCSCWGLPGRTHYCAAGELLPHLFTLALAGSLFLWPCSARHRARTLSGSVLCRVRTFLRRIKSARDHLELFDGLILTPRTAEVNGCFAGLKIEDRDA